MEALIWIVVAIVVIVVLLRLLARRAVLGRVDPTELLLDPELVDRVRALAQADQKVAAIKLLRDGTPGLGLAPAKQMVDRMAASPRPPAIPPGPTGPVRGRADPVGVPPGSRTRPPTADHDPPSPSAVGAVPDAVHIRYASPPTGGGRIVR